MPAEVSRAGSPRSQEDMPPAEVSRAGSPRSQDTHLKRNDNP